MDEITKQIEAAKQELVTLQAEIETLRAKKSIAECVREAYSVGMPIRVLKRKVRKPLGRNAEPVVEVTLLESDYQRLTQMARSSSWVERKLAELQHLGEKLWHKLNQSTILRDAIQRAEEAEIRCRSLEQQLAQVMAAQDRPHADFDTEDDIERELSELDFNDREP